MSLPTPRVVLVFGADDQAWIRRSSITVPAFWNGHEVPPVQGDVVRFSGRQFTIQGRLWEQDGDSITLKLYMSSAHAPSDTDFGPL
ncbi:MAG: hypothetical protein AB7S86_02220 [Hydrogenophaga sp.]|uniref:hypothetical protein n=1 Tax=Hydrogenophaga sp. TaxID=1904254 RepID=UPI003D0DE038